MNNTQTKDFSTFIEEARQSTTNYKRFQLSDTIPQRLADKSMKKMTKLERINDFLENFDEVKSADSSRQFKNSDGSRAKTLEIKKDYIEELGHLIEAVPINKNRSLEVVSMYYENKIEDTEQVPDDFKSPGHTPKTQPTNNVSSD